nr:MAG TPA: hypothetical protein [Caudoviricetes sp.]
MVDLNLLFFYKFCKKEGKLTSQVVQSQLRTLEVISLPISYQRECSLSIDLIQIISFSWTLSSNTSG